MFLFKSGPGNLWAGRSSQAPTENRLSRYEVSLPRLPFLDRDSVANVQGLASIPTVRLERKPGRLPGDAMRKLKGALAFALDLESANQ
jgi:mRNA interferase MazF